jgi:hypothetical protein
MQEGEAIVAPNPAAAPIEWAQLRHYPEHDIMTTYPFQIRKRRTGRIIRLTPDSGGYLQCCLNGRRCLHHRVIAEQFLPNVDNLSDVDHINHIRNDNRLDNLRWVTHQDNMRNKSRYGAYQYRFLDELPADAITVEEWNGHEFEGLYYVGDGEFVIFNGIRFRMLVHVLINGNYHVQCFDTNHRTVGINIARYRILINDVPIELPEVELDGEPHGDNVLF